VTGQTGGVYMLDWAGSPVWQRQISVPGTSLTMATQATAVGGITSTSNGGTVSAWRLGNGGGVLVRLSASGDVVWSTRTSGASLGFGAVHIDAAGDVYTHELMQTSPGRFVVHKFNGTTGQSIWQRQIAIDGQHIWLNGLTTTATHLIVGANSNDGKFYFIALKHDEGGATGRYLSVPEVIISVPVIATETGVATVGATSASWSKTTHTATGNNAWTITIPPREDVIATETESIDF